MKSLPPDAQHKNASKHAHSYGSCSPTKRCATLIDFLRNLFCRLSNLDRLTIAGASISQVFVEHVSPMRLQDLKLEQVNFGPSSVHGFFRLPIFPNLTKLVLKGCNITGWGDVTLTRTLETLQ